MKSALNPLMQDYDESVIDTLPIRRRRKDLHSLHLFRLKLFCNWGLKPEDPSGNLILFRQTISAALGDFPSSPQFLFCWTTVESQKVGLHKPSDNLSQANSSLMRKIFSIIYDLNRERRVSQIRAGDGGASTNIATGLHQ